MPTPHHVPAQLSDADLEDWGPLAMPLATPLGDPMPTRGLELFATDDSALTAGTWQCDPGSSRWDFTSNGEVIHVLSGHMTCTEDDGTVVEARAGSTVVFPKGWGGTWTVHETLRKVYVIFR